MLTLASVGFAEVAGVDTWGISPCAVINEKTVGVFERGEPVENTDAFVWLEGQGFAVECRFEFVEQFDCIALSAALGISGASSALLSLARFVIGCVLVCEKLINIAELFVGKLVPALRHDEVNRDCLHIKSAVPYCESMVKHSMGRKRQWIIQSSLR